MLLSDCRKIVCNLTVCSIIRTSCLFFHFWTITNCRVYVSFHRIFAAISKGAVGSSLRAGLDCSGVIEKHSEPLQGLNFTWLIQFRLDWFDICRKLVRPLFLTSNYLPQGKL
ncbi:unnamed protein product [Amaranthus hypochondriacus]